MEMIASVLLELRAKANKEMVCFGTRLLSSIFLCVSSSDIFVFLWGGVVEWGAEAVECVGGEYRGLRQWTILSPHDRSGSDRVGNRGLYSDGVAKTPRMSVAIRTLTRYAMVKAQ